jgi:hypothetical protein
MDREDRNMTPRWIGTLGLALVLLALMGGGCRPSGDAAEGRAEPVATGKTPLERPEQRDPDAGLQGAVNRAGSLRLELSPARRPRVLSEAAPDVGTWFRQVLIRGHQESGFADQPGSAEARVAFERYAEIFGEEWGEDVEPIVEAARLARQAGSPDPFLLYIMARYGAVPDSSAGRIEQARGMVESVLALHGTRHHPLIRFIAAFRATSHVRQADWNTVRDNLNMVVSVHMEDAIRDTNAPPKYLFGQLVGWLRFTGNPAWVEWVLEDAEALLKEHWGQTAHYHGLMAEVGVIRAWKARGSGYANTVTSDGWKKFGQQLALAERHLNQAWQMELRDPDLAVVGLKIELGQAKGRAVAERWFERAMALDPNHYDACSSMAYYLEPKWHGSEQECLRFARKCVQSEVWGGRVPLILADTHHKMAAWKKQAESPAYWGRPEVWTDIRDSYEKFFRLNTDPESRRFRHAYARDAFLCGKHAQFLVQVDLLGDSAEHGFFGGEAELERMLAHARAAMVGGR